MNTGEFARRCATEKRTIFYYEQIGLLKPVAIHENGYREYSDAQLEIMDMIKVLQAAGFSLREIKKVIAKPPEARRMDFFDAKTSLEMRIRDLECMKRYIEKKQQLWREYCDFQKEPHPYRYEFCRFVYQKKAVDGTEHFFSFLQDREYELFYMDTDRGMFLMKEDPEGTCREGMAIRLFLELRSGPCDILLLIREKLREFGFCEEPGVYLRTLPHLLLEDGKAVVQATVFGHFEENGERNP